VAIKTFEFYSEISGICPVVKDSPEWLNTFNIFN
jgi:hypothetical protein